MSIAFGVFWAWLAGCEEPDAPCRADILAYADADGDGFGGEEIGLVCALEAGQTDQPLDCDDASAEIHPDAAEKCNSVDDDCDGEIDDGKDTVRYFADEDGDGVGGQYPSVLACRSPGEGWSDRSDDCDDGDPDVRPGNGERCGGGDEDCDGYLDDADDDVDPESYLSFYRDADRDGLGNRQRETQACTPPPGFVDNFDDCDDADPSIGLLTFYEDLDGDGFGDPDTSVQGCQGFPGTSENGDDCDDTDPRVHEVADWLADLDGDGFGSGIPVVTQCSPPGGGLVSSVPGRDCDETDPRINPAANDTCEDGIDQDCDGRDPSCGPIGSFNVADGDRWPNDPPVYSCIEACALLFGGVAQDYHCSTDPVRLNYLAYLSGWGDATYCTVGAAEDWSVEPANNPGYNCGSPGCSYSAYVSDNCFNSINYCWNR